VKKYIIFAGALCVAVAVAQTEDGKKYVMLFPHGSSKIAPDAENVAEMRQLTSSPALSNVW
jgi:hypothetical protein